MAKSTLTHELKLPHLRSHSELLTDHMNLVLHTKGTPILPTGQNRTADEERHSETGWGRPSGCVGENSQEQTGKACGLSQTNPSCWQPGSWEQAAQNPPGHHRPFKYKAVKFTRAHTYNSAGAHKALWSTRHQAAQALPSTGTTQDTTQVLT